MSAPVPQWIAAFCSNHEDPRGDLTQPHTLTWNDAPAVGATNGHKMVVVPGEFDATPFAAIGPNMAGIVTTVLATPPRGVRLSALRAFAGVADDPTTCPTCDGTGRVECDECDGAGIAEHECSCGDIHDGDCEACDGGGRVPCPACMGKCADVEVVQIGDDTFNRRLLAEVVRALPTPPDDALLSWHQQPPTRDQHYPAALACDAWVAVLMPLRQSDRELRGTFTAWAQEIAA